VLEHAPRGNVIGVRDLHGSHIRVELDVLLQERILELGTKRYAAACRSTCRWKHGHLQCCTDIVPHHYLRLPHQLDNAARNPQEECMPELLIDRARRTTSRAGRP
jgi:hypothetical protein